MVYETGLSHSQLGLSLAGSEYRNRILSAGDVHSSADGKLTDDSQHTRVTSNEFTLQPFLQSISVVNSYRIPNLSKSGSAASAIHNQNNLGESHGPHDVPKDGNAAQGTLQIDHTQHATFDESKRAGRRDQLSPAILSNTASCEQISLLHTNQ